MRVENKCRRSCFSGVSKKVPLQNLPKIMQKLMFGLEVGSDIYIRNITSWVEDVINVVTLRQALKSQDITQDTTQAAENEIGQFEIIVSRGGGIGEER